MMKHALLFAAAISATVWEAVTGKPPSDGALRGLMTVGLTLLLSLMAFALLMDVTCV